MTQPELRKAIISTLNGVLSWDPTQKLLNWGLSHAPSLLPVKPFAQTDYWMAFRHPNPTYPVHILIIPRMAVKDWLSLPTSQPEMYVDFVELSQRLIMEEGLNQNGYRLIINGGEYQSIKQLHVHLVSGEPLEPT